MGFAEGDTEWALLAEDDEGTSPTLPRDPLSDREGPHHITHSWHRELHLQAYMFMEEPSTSWPAFLQSCFILFCVICSCICFLLETTTRLSAAAHPEYENRWFWIESAFSGIFSVEYALRFCTTPLSTYVFVSSPMNLVDIISVLPFWIQLITAAKSNFQFLRIFRLVRIFRLFKLARQSSQLRLIMTAFGQSGDALVILSLFLGMSCTVFAALMWFVERGEWDEEMGCFTRIVNEDTLCSPFQSVPASYYWAITTMTTVGYGDVTAVTLHGRIVANLAMVTGVFVLAMPVSVLGTQFGKTYATVKADMQREKEALEQQLNPVRTSDKWQDAEALLKEFMEKKDKLEPILQLLRDEMNLELEADYPDHDIPQNCGDGLQALGERFCRPRDRRQPIVERTLNSLEANVLDSMEQYHEFISAMIH
eukprot:NODE_627_length_1437_cov_387.209117.p1 GENE.NODE_627_length_1437_cov_387.209117~~NODE_627_length_1437_cov_387.209117.p1  ORF type:complete len:423 (+),score=149.76 NODE_627_length_1437_cov_387.209117:3-1271(+)